MSETSTYGGLTLPLPATPAGRVRDPIAHALLDYIGFYLNTMLGPQFALLYPSTPTPCPSSSRFAYDPKEVWPQNSIPALYLHWKGARSQTWSLVRDREVATYELTWIAPGRNEPGGAANTSGIVAVAARVLRQAADRGWHPSYSYNGAPTGEPVHISVGFQGWELSETMPGLFRPVPSTKGARADYYPALKAQIKTFNIIEAPAPQDPGDALGGSVIGIYTNGQGDIHDTVLFSQANLPAPDGSEDGDE